MEEQVPGSAMPPQSQSQMPNFEAMRQLAMQQAIEQIAAQRPAQPQSQPSGPVPVQVSPSKAPATSSPQYVEQKYSSVAPTEQVRVVRRNLTRPELLAVFVVACIAVTGVQAVWNFTTNILPRIEIRAN